MNTKLLIGAGVILGSIFMLSKQSRADTLQLQGAAADAAAAPPDQGGGFFGALGAGLAQTFTGGSGAPLNVDSSGGDAIPTTPKNGDGSITPLPASTATHGSPGNGTPIQSGAATHLDSPVDSSHFTPAIKLTPLPTPKPPTVKAAPKPPAHRSPGNGTPITPPPLNKLPTYKRRQIIKYGHGGLPNRTLR